jgi:hypothetical protein
MHVKGGRHLLRDPIVERQGKQGFKYTDSEKLQWDWAF